ncbi:MAG TPA: porin [Magnetospirillaceae bacterium]|jgi:phosphate-selective porin OprO/OprP
MSVEKNLGGAGELSGRKRRLATSSAIALVAGMAAFAGMAQAPARADDSQQLQLLEDQIRQLQAQIDGLKKTQAQQATMTPTLPAGAKPAYGYETGGHQFGWVSADGQDSIELTGRLHFDVGSYTHFSHDAGLTSPTGLNSGVDARRARIGVTGKFASDFAYTFIAEFGGTDDTNNPFVSGFGASEIENAFITYNGFNKADHFVPLAFDVGYIDVPFTLDESVSSNDTMFMERSSSQVVATAFGGGDNRSAAGLRSYKTAYWAGAYVTGPAAGDAHSAPVTVSNTTSAPTTVSPSGEPLAFLGRATYNPWSDADGNNIHVGANVSYVVQPGATTTEYNTGSATPATSVAGNHSISLSDRPELRIDPTAILSTGAINNVRNAEVYGAELAGQFDHFFAQGEYYLYDVQRYHSTALPNAANLDFDGGYGQASWSIGGKRHYNPSTGAYTGVIPDAPLNISSGSGWGALEFGARFSYTDLKSGWTANTASAAEAGVNGGTQTAVTLGMNYYVSSNVRLMLNYVHADISKESTAATSVANGAKVDAIAGRFQVAW